MESYLDSQSLSTAASSSTPHTPSPPMNEAVPLEYGFETSAQYYVEYPSQQHQQVPFSQHHQQPPTQSQLMDISHPSATAGPLYRRASFPFVHHDHPMSSHYPKYVSPDGYMPEHLPPPPQEHYEYDDSVKLEQTSAMVVPTQVPQPPHHSAHGFYRPSSSSSSVSSVSGPPPSYLNPVMSSIPVMHTDDAASKETQYLRRKCFNCGTTEPPSWRRSTLNPGKIVCNKCGLYERTHNKPRPHQFGLRPGNKARKQPHSQHASTGKMHTLSPSSSPKRHPLSVKKEPLDYSQAMRRGSIASINSGSGTSDWDDHSGYSTASSAYPSSLGMAPPSQHHSLSHHHSHQSHTPSHHGHHPYNSSLAMLPPRSTSNGIRLPQAPPMKIPTKAGSSSPVTGPGIVPGNLNSNPSGNGTLSNSPESLHPTSAHSGSPYGASTLAPSSNMSTLYGNGGLRGPPMIPSSDYYARRGSTSQIPPNHSAQYHEDHLAAMRRGSVGALGMGMTGMSFSDGPNVAQRRPQLLTTSSWQPQQTGSTALSSATPMPIPLSEMSATPAPAAAGYNSADSTPRRSYGTGDLTPSPPLQAHAVGSIPMLHGVHSAEASPIGSGMPAEITSLTA